MSGVNEKPKKVLRLFWGESQEENCITITPARIIEQNLLILPGTAVMGRWRTFLPSLVEKFGKKLKERQTRKGIAYWVLEGAGTVFRITSQLRRLLTRGLEGARVALRPKNPPATAILAMLS